MKCGHNWQYCRYFADETAIEVRERCDASVLFQKRAKLIVISFIGRYAPRRKLLASCVRIVEGSWRGERNRRRNKAIRAEWARSSRIGLGAG
jgi:hypothetical protein